MIHVALANEQTTVPIDEERLRRAVEAVLGEEGPPSVNVSLAVVDDPTIHQLNRRYLRHDYPTDVLSFVLEQSPATLEGEIVVSADTARTAAARYGWSAENELLLYVIHGALHLAGYDDQTDETAAEMRRAEARYLLQFGLAPPTLPVAGEASNSLEGGASR